MLSISLVPVLIGLLKMKLQALVVVIMLALAGCRTIYPVSVPRQLPASVEDAAWLGAACASAEIGPPDFAIHRKKQIGNKYIVMYTSTCPNPGPNSHLPQRIVGYNIIEFFGAGWDSTAGGYYVDLNLDPPTAFARDDIGYGVKGEMVIIFGEVLRPENVATVEVTLSNGQVIRDQLQDQFFIVTAPGATMACERRIIAKDGSVLERKDLGPMLQECK